MGDREDTLLLRALYAAPRPSATWDDLEYEERIASWWELFVDLIVVVAFTNVTDALFESEALGTGLLVFFLTMNLIQASWMKYTHYATRFVDDSLLHSGVLFFFMIGLAGMAVHVGKPALATQFTVSILILRLAVMVMYGTAAAHSRTEGRRHVIFVLAVLVVTAAACVAVISSRPSEYTALTLTMWALIVFLELPNDLFAAMVLAKTAILPLHIDHFVDRQNGFIMVALGESILSAMIESGKLAPEQLTAQYYGCVSLVLLLVFSMGLLYYHVQPRRDDSAYRQSKLRGYIAYFTTCALAMVILLVGVGVKMAMHAVVELEGHHAAEDGPARLLFEEVSSGHEEPAEDHHGHGLTVGQTWFIYGSVAAVLHLTFCIRCAHYWGLQPTPDDSQFARRVKYVWWAVFAVWPVIPLILCVAAVQQPAVDVLWTLGGAAGSCLGLAVFDTLVPHLYRSRSAPPTSVGGAVE